MMIVPQSRLLFWFAVVALPFSALGAMYADAMVASVAIVTGLGVLAALDALLGLGGLDGLQVQLPEVVRLSKDREGAIEVRVQNERQKRRRLRLGLVFPREIQSPDAEVNLLLLDGSEWSRLAWRCIAVKRGNYRLNRICLETASPIGFWAVRRVAPVNAEVRVYPNLLSERKNLAALFLNRGAFGIHAQRQVGKGREFEKLREYIPGDSFEDIHWKATAKRGRPVTKVFQIEKTQEVYVVLDASRLSARTPASDAKGEVQIAGQPAEVLAGASSVEAADFRASLLTPGAAHGTHTVAAETTVLERFITAALVLGLAAEQQGDLFGLLTFADKVGSFIRARNGKAHYSVCRDTLYTLAPQTVSPDFDEVATFIRLRLRRRALLIFLTALDDPMLAESFVRNMDLLCRQHLVLVNMIKPAGAVPLFSQPDVAEMDDLYQHLGGHLQWQKLRELGKVLQRRGVQFSLLENEKLSVQLVSQYLGVKQRQLL